MFKNIGYYERSIVIHKNTIDIIYLYINIHKKKIKIFIISSKNIHFLKKLLYNMITKLF